MDTNKDFVQILFLFVLRLNRELSNYQLINPPLFYTYNFLNCTVFGIKLYRVDKFILINVFDHFLYRIIIIITMRIVSLILLQKLELARA